MKVRNIIFTLIISTVFVSLFSCNKNENNNEINLWVNSFKSNGTGIGAQKCFLIQKGDSIKANNWENLYDNIEGFEYIPGNLYKLKVKVETRKPENTPADASTLRYILIEVLESKIDLKLRLNDIWVLTEINGKDISEFETYTIMENKSPYIEININRSIALAYDGCNKITAVLGNIDDQNLSIINIINTPLRCKNMALPKLLNQGLKAVTRYKISDNKLVLFHKDLELMKFKKVD